MKKFTIIAVVVFIVASCQQKNVEKEIRKPADYVNVFIGTGAYGHTIPGAVTPFGMVQLSPDTDNHRSPGYGYEDSSIMGFSHNHLSGAGCGDYLDVLLMPTVGNIQLQPGAKENPDGGYRSRFDHADETASPGYYAVKLKDYNVRAELTATTRVGFHRYTFPASAQSNIILDLQHSGIGISCAELPADTVRYAELKIVNEYEIEGYRVTDGWGKGQYIYFVARFNKPFAASGIAVDDSIIPNGKVAKGRNLKCFVTYTTTAGEAVEIKVALSPVSIEGARKNLAAEADKLNFNTALANAKNAWDKIFSKIIVAGGEEENKTTFYTALYHTYIHPSVNSDVDGQYTGMDKVPHKAEGYEAYTVFSLWDTYRATHPLLAILEPKRTSDMINSMLDNYKESGILPIWKLGSSETKCMNGNHAIPVILDAWQKGIRSFDGNLAFEAMKASVNTNRQFGDIYRQYKYLPADYDSASTLKMMREKSCPNWWIYYNVETVSRITDFCYDDWCVAQMAKLLGKQDDYNEYMERSRYYLNIFDTSIGFLRPKNMNGQWKGPFNPVSATHNEPIPDFTEGNGWQYLFAVPHDIKKLETLLGGKEKFAQKLDSFFNTSSKVEGSNVQDIFVGMVGQYNHGNEPSHHDAYLYNYCGQPWKTQALVRTIMEKFYNNSVEGIQGNDDCGQMSSWYVLSALGFYPVCVGDNVQVLGSPIFDKATINLANGKQFAIEAKNVSKQNKYIQSAMLNGSNWDKNFFMFSDLKDGGELALQMGSQPNKNWGSAAGSLPPGEDLKKR